jgi:hypothetical protein
MYQKIGLTSCARDGDNLLDHPVGGGGGTGAVGEDDHRLTLGLPQGRRWRRRRRRRALIRTAALGSHEELRLRGGRNLVWDWGFGGGGTAMEWRPPERGKLLLLSRPSTRFFFTTNI